MEFDLENPLPASSEFLHEGVTALFHIESNHMPLQTYPQTLIFNRREAISLILNVCQNYDFSLSYLAVNYLDRFLSTQTIQECKPWILRLVAVSCVSLALKMKETEVFVLDIEQEDGIIFEQQAIQRMEKLILGALKWRMRSITPFSFISFFISLFKSKDQPFIQALKARAAEIIFKAQNEFKLLEFKPSLVAASALLSAVHELFALQFPCFRQAILKCSYVNKDEFLSCYNVMQEVVMDEWYESVLDMPAAAVASRSCTPVNVLEQQWSSWSSVDSEKTNQTVENRTIGMAPGLEKDLKRRKVSNDKIISRRFSFRRFNGV